ncbi:hypothetical protein CAL29_23225 [Bordetella genomosp. 10]|uniref:Pentapeptide repeat-containing protein n=1 Tax=Bordetella genomosp. 10 TaxID=1416804 RepID=A0A261S1R0_9BORD|nr:pentapeptide repeat-containing protein [Bordetella genomosp. 10]OZI30882.1 hypothetical protein CAL29_23225 [Bordetella genomosp. 10]
MHMFKIGSQLTWKTTTEIPCADATPQGIRAGIERYANETNSISYMVFDHMNLTQLHLPDGCNAEGATFRNCNLVGLVAKGCTFDYADLSGADISGAIVENSSFGCAKAAGLLARGLRGKGSFWTGSRIRQARFDDADLRLTHFSHARAEGASFKNAQLLLAHLSTMAADLSALLECCEPAEVIQAALFYGEPPAAILEQHGLTEAAKEARA